MPVAGAKESPHHDGPYVATGICNSSSRSDEAKEEIRLIMPWQHAAVQGFIQIGGFPPNSIYINPCMLYYMITSLKYSNTSHNNMNDHTLAYYYLKR